MLKTPVGMATHRWTAHYNKEVKYLVFGAKVRSLKAYYHFIKLAKAYGNMRDKTKQDTSKMSGSEVQAVLTHHFVPLAHCSSVSIYMSLSKHQRIHSAMSKPH